MNILIYNDLILTAVQLYSDKSCYFLLQSLYKNQVKDLKHEVDEKNKQIEDAVGDLKSIDSEK